MKPYFHLFASVLFVLLPAEILPVNAQDKFSFFAIGDMPYHNTHDLERFPEIVQTINAEKPAFTVHVGDIIPRSLQGCPPTLPTMDL